MSTITFDALPTNKSSNNIEKGTYYATIEVAEMRQPKDPQKPLYLNMLLALKDSTGKPVGKIYDILTESDANLIRYKLARFIKALKLEKTLTNFELSDLCKIIKDKELIVDVTPEIKDREETGRTVVDVFTNEIYYPIEEASQIFGNMLTTPQVINAEDAKDATVHEDVNSDDMF